MMKKSFELRLEAFRDKKIGVVERCHKKVAFSILSGDQKTVIISKANPTQLQKFILGL